MANTLWENILRKEKSQNDILGFLQSSFLFQDLSKRQTSFLTKIVHIRNYRAGETIFKQGDTGAGMYLIMKGTVDIIAQRPSADKVQSEQVYITSLERGDFFGELSLVEESSLRSATAVCQIDAKLIGFFKPDLMEIISRDLNTGNKIVLRLAEILGRRLRETTEKISDLVTEIKMIEVKTKPSNEESESGQHFTS